MKNLLILLFAICSIKSIYAQTASKANFPWYLDPSHKANINMIEALKIAQGGSSNVRIGVIDTGLDKDHTLLKDTVVYQNGKPLGSDLSPLDMKPVELTTNLDLDKPFNPFANKNLPTKRELAAAEKRKKSFPKDTHGHGTHIAGIIAAKYNPTNGVAGIAPLSKIIPVKYYNPKAGGQENLDATVESLRWSLKNNINIINYSGGGPEPSLQELRILKEMEKQGIVIVAAAGNNGQNLDQLENAYYPCSYNLSNIICVGNNDSELKQASTSNYSKKIVHISAPGTRIKSTLPNGRYGYMSGTSQATAFVSGAVALMMSVNPYLRPNQIKNILMETSTKSANLINANKSSGTLNVSEAVKYSKKISLTK